MTARSITPEALAELLIDALQPGIDPVRAADQQRYMKSSIPYLGLRLPEVRTAVAPVLSGHRLTSVEDWRRAITLLWDEVEYREEWYVALALARHRHYREWVAAVDQLDLYEHMIRASRWWDVCDEIAAHLVGGVLAADPGVVTPILRAWSTDGDLWIRRCSILSQLRRKSATDRDLLAGCILNSVDDRDFFARKAIGWALREFSRTDPAWVRAFVAEHDQHLSPLSKKEALRVTSRSGFQT